MSGYLIRRGEHGHYLEVVPATGALEFLATAARYATAFTLEAATALAAYLHEYDPWLEVDDYRPPVDGWPLVTREPTFDVDDLDPDIFCLRHGRMKPVGPYGVRYGGCSDCEPPEPDGEAFRGGEADAYQREQMATAQRLKR